jgi:hypothetical protein
VWLITCQDGDVDAVTLADRLRERGLEPIELVYATELVHGARWEHRVGAGGCRTRVTLADGRELDSSEIRGVLNRLLWISAEGFLGASEVDREYAGGELFALVQSWLASLGDRVIGRPAGPSLGGPWRTADQWRARAREAGLRIRMFPGDELDPLSGRWVLVLDGAVVDGDGAPDAVRAGCARLAAELDLDVLEARFDDDWAFADATLLPVLGTRGDERVEGVALALRGRGR